MEEESANVQKLLKTQFLILLKNWNVLQLANLDNFAQSFFTSKSDVRIFGITKSYESIKAWTEVSDKIFVRLNCCIAGEFNNI